MQPDLRDGIVDFVREWSEKTELPSGRLVRWVGVGTGRFYDWKRRYGQLNEHNAWIPRDHWFSVFIPATLLVAFWISLRNTVGEVALSCIGSQEQLRRHAVP